MLFNSFEFIFIFLPIVFILYFLLLRYRLVTLANGWLALSSLIFYSWWNIAYLPLILISIICNYVIGYILGKGTVKISRKFLFIIGISFNIGLLAYYKYFDFFISNINSGFQTNIPLLHLVLPLGISFFSFTQIAYLVDSYRRESTEYNFQNYVLFVTFFPHLIAGPILHHNEMMPQFSHIRNKIINWKNISIGLLLFAIGLVKKVIVADTFAVWATNGFDYTSALTFFEAWIASLSYTLQLYFDFSGYTDMAIGIALLFNIKLPANFNSPYKSLNIQEFWRRWHITLGRFLTKYLYIPLGGNRKGSARTYINLFFVFLISGIWHGAGWTFIIWGVLHGLASVINRYWQSFNVKMNKFLAWFITFNFINVAWVFFRASSWEDAIKVLSGMIGLNGFALPTQFSGYIQQSQFLEFLRGTNFTPFYIQDKYELLKALIYILTFVLVATLFRNSQELSKKFSFGIITSTVIVICFVFSILTFTKVSEFLYFNF